MEKWSRIYMWQERVAAYDEHLAAKVLGAKEVDIEKRLGKHRELTDKILEVVEKKVNQLLSSGEWADLTPAEALKFYEVGIKIDRLTHGLATDNVKEEQAGETKVVVEFVDQWRQVVEQTVEVADGGSSNP